ncbi:HNH endonuclease domain-containing protein [Deinococcus sp. QL22]|uniref:HNH endonuclease domain-containing protein n=1 Tax=Deinococcus sp. QL22 TaxID=2939437 RepID=UPI002017B373|nr:HNH endonuclease [Deinococcus sp. QL22]UQN10384.1 HNH endonuclease [Deinococcus sp. QL22]UQN10518.1 HNH endonuclease [Deinococcus sp. QL22]
MMRAYIGALPETPEERLERLESSPVAFKPLDLSHIAPEVFQEVPPVNQKLPVATRVGADGTQERRCRSCGEYLPEDKYFFHVAHRNPERLSHTCRDCQVLLHEGRRRASSNLTRARRVGQDMTHLPEIPAALFKQQQGRCYYCGLSFDVFYNGYYDLEHKIPLSRGGTNEHDNLVLSCRPCNFDKKNRTPDEWRAPTYQP